jgi:hypothetical protein
MNTQEFNELFGSKKWSKQDLIKMYCYLMTAIENREDSIRIVFEKKVDSINAFDKQIKEHNVILKGLEVKQIKIINELQTKWGVVL